MKRLLFVLNTIIFALAAPVIIWANSFDTTAGVYNAGLSGGLQALGYHGMALDASMKDAKGQLSMVASGLGKYEAGEDYVENSIVFTADSKKKAEEIASCYNAKLVYFHNGVAEATIDFTDENKKIKAGGVGASGIPNDVEDVIRLASGNNNLPAVYPNFIYTVDDIQEDDIQEDDGVYAEDEELVGASTDDPYAKAQWFHDYINDEKVWDTYGNTGKGVVVAVVDTGVNSSHKDLKDRIYKTRYNAITDDSNSEDDHGHGSHCAGIIAATANNGTGGVGVAPGAYIMPIKVMSSTGTGKSNIIASGIYYATENGADILNMSLGNKYRKEDILKNEAVAYAVKHGKVVVAAVGNEHSNVINSPALFDGVISVASLALPEDIPEKIKTKSASSFSDAIELVESMGRDGKPWLSYFSNYHKDIDIAAPGSGIVSTAYKKGTNVNTYAILSGTSQATPVVSGVAALILAQDPSIKKLSGQKVSDTVCDIIKLSSNGETYVNFECTIKDADGNKVHLKEGEHKVTCGLVDAKKSVDIAEKRSSLDTINPPAFSGYNVNLDGSVKVGPDEYLTISAEAATEGMKLYYTDNGHDPRTDGKLYKSPIPINKNGKKTYKAVLEYLGKYSSVATFTAQCYTPATMLESGGDMYLIGGKSATIKPKFAPTTASLVLDYSSSDTSVATVSSKGVVKANAMASTGAEAVITVKDRVSGFSFDFKVNVTNKADTFVKLPESYKKGITLSVLENTAMLPLEAELNSDLLAAGNILEDIQVITSNTSIVAYENGRLVAKRPGKAKITIRNTKFNTKAAFKVKVVAPVVNISIVSQTGEYLARTEEDNPVISIPSVKGKVKLTAIINENTFAATNKKLAWTSSDPDYLKVSKSGVVTSGKMAVKSPMPGKEVKVTVTTLDGTTLVRHLTFVLDGK